MAKNIKINHIETLFSAVVIRNAEEMIRRNREREAELFKSYNPLTGENAPGKRKRICLDDFVNSSVFLPVEMFSTGFIYKLNLAGSIEEFCWQTYGEYNEDLRNTVIQELLRYWAKYDFYFYCYAYARIKNKEGGEDVPFLLRPAQVKLAETFERMRRAGKPIRVILLKARQWGGSTCTQIYMSWIQIMHVKSWNSIIVGHQGDSAAEVKDMYVKLITQLPEFLFMKRG